MLVILPAQDATPPAELRQHADQGCASVSAAHEVPPDATALHPLLEARGWRRLIALLDAPGGEGDRWRGVWYAEHARAQLAPGSRCSSEPAWVAWTCWRPQAAIAVRTPASDQTLRRRGMLITCSLAIVPTP